MLSGCFDSISHTITSAAAPTFAYEPVTKVLPDFDRDIAAIESLWPETRVGLINDPGTIIFTSSYYGTLI